MKTDKIGINISKLRIERGITQEQLGRDIGLTASAISNIECGRSVPSVDTLCRFSELFGVKVDTILSDESDSDLNKLEMEEKLVTVDRYLSEIKNTVTDFVRNQSLCYVKQSLSSTVKNLSCNAK